MKSKLQPMSTQQTPLPIAPITPKTIVQSESLTAVILAIAILLTIVFGSITTLIQIILTAKKSG
jgi:hypothetical protein